jgi:NAD+ diphosphatase
VIQDIGERRFDITYRAAEPEPGDYALAYQGSGTLLAEKDGRLVLPRVRDWTGGSAAGPQSVGSLCLRYLFCVGDARFFLVDDAAVDTGAVECPAGFVFASIQTMRFYEPRWLAYAATAGMQLWRWYRNNRYCGRCGAELGHVATSRELVCPSCGNVVYPRINPCIIVGICWGDRLLLTKFAQGRIKHYALVSGFCEVGETLGQTIEREVMEEVSLRVRNLRFYKSQPWPFSDSLLMGFFADVDGDPMAAHPDHVELSVARWVRREDLPTSHEDTSSLTNEMIEVFARGEEPRGDAR